MKARHWGHCRLAARCYRSSLALAASQGLRTIAFPGISTGIYGFPRDRAATIAVHEIRAFLAVHALPDKVILVAFDDDSHAALRTALDAPSAP